MSYLNGYTYLIGLITANSTLAYTSGEFIIYIANTLNENQITSQGAYVGLYCAIIIAATMYNFLGMRFSSYLNKFLVFGTIVFICTIPAVAPTHNTAKWVFTEFINNTGYSSNAMVFFVGMVSL
jgi:hypothetical protein